jgi:hypothetical protein
LFPFFKKKRCKISNYFLRFICFCELRAVFMFCFLFFGLMQCNATRNTQSVYYLLNLLQKVDRPLIRVWGCPLFYVAHHQHNQQKKQTHPLDLIDLHTYTLPHPTLPLADRLYLYPPNGSYVGRSVMKFKKWCLLLVNVKTSQ